MRILSSKLSIIISMLSLFVGGCAVPAHYGEAPKVAAGSDISLHTCSQPAAATFMLTEAGFLQGKEQIFGLASQSHCLTIVDADAMKAFAQAGKPVPVGTFALRATLTMDNVGPSKGEVSSAMALAPLNLIGISAWSGYSNTTKVAVTFTVMRSDGSVATSVTGNGAVEANSMSGRGQEAFKMAQQEAVTDAFNQLAEQFPPQQAAR